MCQRARFLAGRSWPSLVCLGLLACAGEPERPEPPAPEPLPSFELRPISFEQLAGWRAEDTREALHAFHRSCAKLAQRDPAMPMGPDPLFGQVGDWQAVCTDAAAVAESSADQARAFVEDRFSSYLVVDGANP
jgi:membrane-bound lytic murein transglycosylase A